MVVDFFVLVADQGNFKESTYRVIFQYVINAIGSAYLAVVIAVTYHQLRTAKEGLDSEQLAAVFD